MGSRPRQDLVGRRVGRWTVLRHSHMRGKHSYFLCRCDCGTERPVMRQSLRGGNTFSCGCFMREVNAARPNNNQTHGMRHSPEYSVWSGIKRRCENPREKCFHRYGGAGVQCQFSSFEEFISEVGKRPSSKHSIDRIDPHGHYAPGNVRWATSAQQARNKKRSFTVTISGETKPLADWCDDYSQPYKRVWQRIHKFGWTPERALKTGVQP